MQQKAAANRAYMYPERRSESGSTITEITGEINCVILVLL